MLLVEAALQECLKTEVAIFLVVWPELSGKLLLRRRRIVGCYHILLSIHQPTGKNKSGKRTPFGTNEDNNINIDLFSLKPCSVRHGCI